MQAGILRMFRESATVKLRFVEEASVRIEAVAREMAEVLRRGGKLLFLGNGGSAADAQHLAAEFVNRFLVDRKALAALALTTDTSVLTSIGNDLGMEQIFSRQVEALARPGDLVVAISTSGNSPDVLRAVEAARRLGCRTIGLTGGSGGAWPRSWTTPLSCPARRRPASRKRISLWGTPCVRWSRVCSSKAGTRRRFPRTAEAGMRGEMLEFSGWRGESETQPRGRHFRVTADPRVRLIGRNKT